jgi:hypothetical protein
MAKKGLGPVKLSFGELESMWIDRKEAFVESTWRYFMKDMTHVEVYAYVKPSHGTTWGELLMVRGDAKAPEGYELVTAERIPPAGLPDIRRWFDRFAGRLPVFPPEL